MKKKFERVFTLLLAALLVVSMAGCGGTPSEPPGEEGNDGGGYKNLDPADQLRYPACFFFLFFFVIFHINDHNLV